MDICHGQRREREMSLYLVFEHVHQDLASYLEKCPSPGLQPERVNVSFICYIHVFPESGKFDRLENLIFKERYILF